MEMTFAQFPAALLLGTAAVARAVILAGEGSLAGPYPLASSRR
jgi:hypothetical protein